VTRTAAIVTLAALAAALTLAAALGGILSQQPGQPVAFTSARGEPVELFGHGLYRYDSLFSGANYRAQDLVMLVLGVPVLCTAAVLASRGSRRGRLLLAAAFGAVAYVYASMALMAAFNSYFLVYVAILSTSLCGLVLTLVTLAEHDTDGLGGRPLPYRSGGIFLLAGGAVTLVVWLLPLLGAQLGGSPPEHLDHYTTMVTDALDLALITPGAVIAGVLLLRRLPLGMILAMPLLGIIVLLLPLIVGGTVSQVAAGIEFTPAELVGPIAGFGLLGVAGTILLAVAVHRAADPVVRQAPPLPSGHVTGR
jgi:hypothetical protein